uniref:Uncharacterized protein MANES_05G123900 n=2 Tax=Rhizophora mucronata TaxID=61149 RepID=A0A2P2IRZ2_RHIMU
MTRRKKKKGRPSLLDLQKRSLKQQQQQQPKQIPNFRNPNSLHTSATRSRRTRSPNSNPGAPEWIGCEGDDDEDDERKDKKHKLLLGLNSRDHDNNHHHHYSINSANSLGPNFYVSNSNAGGDYPEAALKRRKIGSAPLGSDDMGGKDVKATDALHGSLVEPGPTTPLPDKKLLVFILDRLQKKDTHGVFSEPVDPEELPDYHDIIENPMDFATIRKRLDEGAYSNLEEFEKDIFQICSNAMEYNSPDTIFFRQARSIQELAKKDFVNLRQESDDGEQVPKVVRRGRPPGKLKKLLEKSPINHVGPQISSDPSPATGTDNANGYNLRRTATSSKFEPANKSLSASHITHSSETYACWLSEWENEFPASVLKAVLKYGKKPFALDEKRRETYEPSSAFIHSSPVFTMFEGELKQLLPVGLDAEHRYAMSLARFASDLGPIIQKLASKKIQCVLPMGLKFGPGLMEEETNPIQEQQFSYSDGPRASDNCTPHDYKIGLQPLTSCCADSIVTGCVDGREDMVEAIGGLSSQSELSLLNIAEGGINLVHSVPSQQKTVIRSAGNGFNGEFWNNFSPQMGMARLGIAMGTSNLEHGAISSQMVNTTFSPLPDHNFNLPKSKLSDISNGLLHSGNLSALCPGTDSCALVDGGFGSKSPWQGLSPYHQQDFHPFSPDWNVGFLAQCPLSSSVPIGSPQHPDLALQL